MNVVYFVCALFEAFVSNVNISINLCDLFMIMINLR